ncbi:MAG: DUF2207 domain-containing protein [Acidobacteriota bacterium]|nr:DUF2207 domain-containing protein [Acidobacteriota bacterium]
MTARLIAVALLVLLTVPLSAAKEHVAERHDVHGTVQADGSLEVVELIAFRFSGGEFTYVTREIPARYTDGVEVLSAAMDGRELPQGEEAGQVEISTGRRSTRVKWRFAPVRDGRHVFALRYRLLGIVRHGEGEDWFAWEPYPSRLDYTIDAGTASLMWMTDARLRRQPETAGAVAASSPSATGMEVAVANYRQKDENVAITVRFEPGTFQVAEPQWQRDERRADRMAPSFMAAAAMIGAATALALWLFYLRYRREKPERTLHQHQSGVLPDTLSPGLAGSIVSGRVSASWPQMLGVLFDLAGKGVIRIEEEAGSGKKRGLLLRRGHDAPLTPHERFVRDVAFADGDEPKFDKAMRSLGAKAGTFAKTVRADLARAGFLEADRQEGARALLISGTVVMLFAGALLVVAIATRMRLGEAALLIPLAFFLSGLAMVIAGASFSTLSRSGLATAARWEAYRQHLKAQAKAGHHPASAQEVNRVLPYVTSLGLLSAWRKSMKNAPDSAVPTWLHTISPADRNAAFVTMLAASSTHVSSGAVGGTSGAAGGGSASAG